jgi:hypothetical protein
MAICIWCKKEHSAYAVEHIIPEAIGCPPEFTLKNGEVCKHCNNRLAHLDREIADTFDFVCFHYGIPRKGQRQPAVTSRGNFVGRYTSEGKTVFVNMDPVPITAEHGVRLGAYGKSARNIKAEKTIHGDRIEVTYSVEMRFSKKFVRGLHKIALGSLTFFLGAKEALDQKYDCIRRYVNEGEEERKALAILSEDWDYRNQVWPPYRSKSGDHTLVVRLAVMECAIDLSRDLAAISELQIAGGQHGRGLVMTLPT